MRIAKERYYRLLSDIEDMDSYHPFIRCLKCKHLIPKGFCCPTCGADPTETRRA